jgi:hypothetical protein
MAYKKSLNYSSLFSHWIRIVKSASHGGRYQDRMTETERNDNEYDGGPEWDQITFGTKSEWDRIILERRNETESRICPNRNETDFFFKQNKSAHESVKLVVIVRDSYTRPQNRLVRLFFIIW